MLNNENMANIISIIALVISVLSAIIVTYLSAQLSYKYNQKMNKKEHINRLLEEFYGPLLAVLNENTVLYKEFGPATINGMSAEIAAANGDRWNSIKKEVLIPNLKFARLLLQKYWIQIQIDKKQYLKELMLHCTAFCEYDSTPNEMYYRYKYKPEWIVSLNNEIETVRQEVLK